jgi:serine protease Do
MKTLNCSSLLLATAALVMCSPPPQAKDARANLDFARQLNQAFIDLAEKVSPTVVIINVVQKTVVPESLNDDNEAFDGLPPGFLRRFHEELRKQVPDVSRGEGSGLIIRRDGYILTNRHVVEDAESIEVRLRDGRVMKAQVRGVDPQSDIAVIKIDATGLPVATLADSSKVRVGEFAIAIGAPFSFDYSVTFGHVSAKGRSHVIESYEGAFMDQDFIQTDALINPGNSGGPLVNIDGEVIGINTLIHGLHTGIGFAIPSNLAREISDQLVAQGKFTRSWLGIDILAYRDDPDIQALIKGIDDGVVVRSVLPEGPAANSELKPSDIIVSVDGKRVTTAQELRGAIRNKKIGQPVTLEVFRKGKTLQVKVTPGEMPLPSVQVVSARKDPGPNSGQPGVGVTVQPLTSELAAKFGTKTTEGVLVAAVDKNSPAARKGLKAGDIITSVNQKPVSTPKQFRDALKDADLKRGLLINLVSENTPRFEIIKSE